MLVKGTTVQHALRWTALAAIGCALWAPINALPIVNAGVDMPSVPRTTAVGGFIYLAGSVTDNGPAADSTVWSGAPDVQGMSFGDRLSLMTRATLPDTGKYRLELRAYYGTTSYADTIAITVRPNLPFVVLAPREMEQVHMGTRFVIRWQMDPSKLCTVELSLDSGLTSPWLNPGATARDSFPWNVVAGYPNNTLAILKVHEYQVFDPVATRTFLLVNHAPDPYQNVRDEGERLTHPRHLFVNKNRTIRVDGFARGVQLRVYAFDTRGRVLHVTDLAGEASTGGILDQAAAGVLFVKVMQGEQPARTGRFTLLNDR